MKFLYTVRPGSTTGNCSGDLHLFFSSLNAEDWGPAAGYPGHGIWKPSGIVGTTKLASGDSIAFNLGLIANLPDQIYPEGTITVTTAAGKVSGPDLMGQGTLNFVPDQPNMSVWQGRYLAPYDQLSWDIGFTLPVPWDGTSADCHGQWWAIWH
jgi:hypothetical protein